jgi:hypothetical protein
MDREFVRAHAHYAEKPRFSLSVKNMTMRHSFFTKASASSSRACHVLLAIKAT